MRLLLVEDDQTLSRSLAAQLERAGYRVQSAADGREGLYYAQEYPVEIAIIDLGLPGLSGVELIRALRADGKDTPILVLTARDRWQDKVEALKLGADDYVVKPFHVEELMARVDALVRRAGGWAQSELVCGPVTLDTRTQDVRIDGKPLELTGFEYKLLEFLMLHAGEVVSKGDITEALYDQDFERDSNVIEVFIGRLRRKLDPDGVSKPIETLRGRGYRLTLPRGAPGSRSFGGSRKSELRVRSDALRRAPGLGDLRSRLRAPRRRERVRRRAPQPEGPNRVLRRLPARRPARRPRAGGRRSPASLGLASAVLGRRALESGAAPQDRRRGRPLVRG
jgi:two-component system response regulator PhoP